MKEDKRSTVHKKKKKSNKKKKIIFTILFILLFVAGFGGYYVWSILNKVNTNTTISKNREDLGISSEFEDMLKSKGKDEIINVALFGLDRRTHNEPSRSDATMVLTVDTHHKKIKMISIMRDSYVNIEGHGKDKLNHAYAFGGPQLAIKTLNQNFNLNIKDYVAVDFDNMEKIVDALGGVEVDIKAKEIPHANKNINALADFRKIPSQPIKSAGKQNLTGMQALGYSRIRDMGNGDFDRTDRQRIVLNGLFEKISKAGVTQYPSIVSKLLPLVETSFTSTDILKIGGEVITSGSANFEQERFPIDGYYPDGGKKINGIWYLPFDKEATVDQLHKYIFDDIKPTPKQM